MTYAMRSRVDDLQTHCWPVNAAALHAVLPGSTELFTSKQCPTLCAVPVAEVLRRNQSTKFTDLTGVRVGALVVVGLIAFRAGGNSLWAVRCDCGNYERRRWKTMRTAAKHSKQSGCHFCRPPTVAA